MQMGIDLQVESSLIYEQIQQQIDQLITELATLQHDEKIGADVTVAIDNLNTLNQKVQKEYDELKRLAEWKRFTIAFYGETNAGKSTLIEALRSEEHTSELQSRQY